MQEEELKSAIQSAFSYAINFEGTCFRNVQQRFANQENIESSKGSFDAGGRYNIKEGFEVLYLSCDIHTCIEETTHVMRAQDFDVGEALPRTLVAFDVKLSKVLNLTDKNIIEALGISETALKDTDWQKSQSGSSTPVVTQLLGKSAKDVGFEAMLVPSAVWEGTNIDIFTQVVPQNSYKVISIHKLPATRIR
jgi:RES domain-containing protein